MSQPTCPSHDATQLDLAFVTPSNEMGSELLDARLDRVRRAFAERMAREDGAAGLFAGIVTAVPRYRGIVESLGADHYHLRQALVALRLKVQRRNASSLQELLAEADAVLAAIEEHEPLDEIIDGAAEPA